MGLDLTYGSVHRIRRDQADTAKRLIDRQDFSDDDKQLIHAMLFGPVTEPPQRAEPGKRPPTGKWCDIHGRQRVWRANGTGTRCTACEKTKTRAREAS